MAVAQNDFKVDLRKVNDSRAICEMNFDKMMRAMQDIEKQFRLLSKNGAILGIGMINTLNKQAKEAAKKAKIAGIRKRALIKQLDADVQYQASILLAKYQEQEEAANKLAQS